MTPEAARPAVGICREALRARHAGPRVGDVSTPGRHASTPGALQERHLEVSRVHAELECIGDEWTVLDDGSRNGSYLNEECVPGRRRPADGDVIRVGRTRPSYCRPTDAAAESTVPTIGGDVHVDSQAQRRVLAALCRPYAAGGAGRPASNRRIAEERFITVKTVRSHRALEYGIVSPRHSDPRRKDPASG